MEKVNEDDFPLLLDEATMEMLLHDEHQVKNNITANFINKKNNLSLDKFLKQPEVPINRVIAPNEKEKNIFNDIDFIIQSISSTFDEKDNDSILEILKKTSFNIENTVLYFSDKDEYKYLLFTDMEDYIIKNMKNSEQYDQVLNTKGPELVEERERFLNIDF